MKQPNKRATGVLAGIVLLVALFLLAVSGGSAIEILAADATLTPWAYLPLIGRHALPVPHTSWYGVVRAPVANWPIIRQNLGGTVIDLMVGPHTLLSDIIASLDNAQVLGYQVIFHIYDGDTDTNKPWYLDDSGQWVFPQSAIDMLQGVADHPAMFAVYALHEPLDGGVTYVGVEQQKALYNLLKLHAGGLPVYTDIGSLSAFEDRGEPLSDGMCDYCATFPTHFRSDWTSEQCLAVALSRIDADLDTQGRLMPRTQVVFLINTYATTDYAVPMRLPTPHELGVVKDRLCDLDRPMLYYPWHQSLYDATLEDAPELWPVIAAACNEQSSIQADVVGVTYPPSPRQSSVSVLQ